MTLSLFSALPVAPVRRRGQGGVVTPILPLAGARLRFFLFPTVSVLLESSSPSSFRSCYVSTNFKVQVRKVFHQLLLV